METAAVEHAAVQGEEAGEDSTQGTTYAMYGDGAHRIVDFCFVIKELYGKDNGNTCDETTEKGAGNGYHIAACGDGHQTCQGTV